MTCVWIIGLSSPAPPKYHIAESEGLCVEEKNIRTVSVNLNIGIASFTSVLELAFAADISNLQTGPFDQRAENLFCDFMDLGENNSSVRHFILG